MQKKESAVFEICWCIVSSSQSAFISEKQIIDSALIANEVFEEYRAKKRKGWILKCVDWDFLQ